MSSKKQRNRRAPASPSRWGRIKKRAGGPVRILERWMSHRIAVAFLGAAGAIATAVGGPYLYEWWMAPSLSVTYAIGYEERGIRPAGSAYTYYYEMRDLLKSCIGEQMALTLAPPNQGPRPAARLLLWLMIENHGQHAASDIRLPVAFSVAVQSPRLIATPNVSARLMSSETSSRLTSSTIVIESISGQTPAVMVLTVPGDQAVYEALAKSEFKVTFSHISARELPSRRPALASAWIEELRAKEGTLSVGAPRFQMDVTAYVAPDQPPPAAEGTAWYQALPVAPTCPPVR